MLKSLRNWWRGYSDEDLSKYKDMVILEPGAFVMGAPPEDTAAQDWERPAVKVHLTQRYAVGRYLVTQQLWESVMHVNPSQFKGRWNPVERVSWIECVEFCNRLSQMEELEPVYTLPEELELLEERLKYLTNAFDDEVDILLADVRQNIGANGYRLPTEAEWERAAKWNGSLLFSGSNVLEKVAWYKENSAATTHPVGQQQPNDGGIYDMSGNVAEWCWDWWSETPYPSEALTDPLGAPTGTLRTHRGGGAQSPSNELRTTHREAKIPSFHSSNIGFRLCKTIL